MKPTAPVAPRAAAATVAPVAPVTPVDVSEAATADDIAALFATVKPNAIKATVPSASPAPAESKLAAAPIPISVEQTPTPQTAILPTSADELNEAATADDIAALFATVKSGLKTTPSVESGSEKPIETIAPTQQAPAAPPLPSGEQLNEAASADDIAALFASMKK